jgi:hypothetical protein
MARKKVREILEQIVSDYSFTRQPILSAFYVDEKLFKPGDRVRVTVERISKGAKR